MRSRSLVAVAAITLLLAPAAHADLAADEVGLPAPEAALEPSAANEEAAAVAEPAAPEAAPPGPTAYPPNDDIEAVGRPAGAWGAVAVAADLLVMRPIGFASLFAGSAAFVLTSPVRAAIGTLDDELDALRGRARDVFGRPLGAI